MKNTQLDRVSYSFGMKLSLAKYESADFHVSYTTDVGTTEDFATALSRAERQVMDAIKQKHDEIRSSETGLPEAQPSNPGNAPIPAPEPAKLEAPANPNILRKSIREASKVLIAQKRVTKEDFVEKVLKGRKLDEIQDTELREIETTIKNVYGL